MTFNKIKNALRERSPLFSRFYECYLRLRRSSGFDPYLITFCVGDRRFRFFIGSQAAADWYDPVIPQAIVEYEWIVRNVPLKGETIADCGCHHGHYSLVLATEAGAAGFLHAIDPNPQNLVVAEVNLALNRVNASFGQFAVAAKEGFLDFSTASNGRIVAGGGIRVACRPLESLNPLPTVIKLDIEGAEYDVLPAALDRLPDVKAWIVEIHPENRPHPDSLVELFIASGYAVYFLDRDSSEVRLYEAGRFWPIHSTVFALKNDTSNSV